MDTNYNNDGFKMLWASGQLYICGDDTIIQLWLFLETSYQCIIVQERKQFIKLDVHM
jgi:hypothetical protein